jgi:hypothetical protein
MIFDIVQLFVILASIAVFGYYYYQAGMVKGVLTAIEIFLTSDDKEDETNS